MRHLRRSSRLTTSPDTSKPHSVAATTPAKPVPKLPTPSTSTDGASKGTFTTQSYGLKKSKKTRTFGCWMCDVVCASMKELIQHDQQKHNILYCDVCSKAFNNPSLLARHQYSHKELKFKCDDCDQHFPFESNLQTHWISHRTLLTHYCVYPNCNKKFKNKGDLTHHTKEHDGIMHKCPDCSYENPDVRNLESHRLTHSAIEKYACKLCGKTFQFSNQHQRHVNNKKCQKCLDSTEH